MENHAFKLVASVISGVILTFWEAYSAIIVLVAIAVVMDIITGLIGAASAGEQISSKVARRGFWGKMAELSALCFGIYMDFFVPQLMDMMAVNVEFKSPFGLIVGCYIILNELISVVENIAKAKPDIIPTWIVNLLSKSRDEIDKKEGSKNGQKS